MGQGDAAYVATARFLQATAVVPQIYNSTEHILAVREEFMGLLTTLMAEPELLLTDPSTSTGAGALGYYLIYQGLPNLPPRRALAQAYWKWCPSLRYTAPFLETEPEQSAPCRRALIIIPHCWPPSLHDLMDLTLGPLTMRHSPPHPSGSTWPRDSSTTACSFNGSHATN
ncbi:unnamed protein product [Chrysoparadoxa australica]